MNELLKTAVGVCLASSVFSFLIPKGRQEKLLNFILGIFVLLCIITPLKNLFDDLPKLAKHSFDNLYTEEYTAESTLNVIDSAFYNSINQTVTEITGEEALNINLSFSYDNSQYNLNNLEITVDEKYKAKTNQIRNTVYHKFGCNPTVITANGA